MVHISAFQMGGMNMKRKVLSVLLSLVLAASVLTGCGKSGNSSDTGKTASKSSDEGTTGKNTFVKGGTDLALWTFQDQHVGFYTDMADKWNKANPDKPINLTVSVADSASMHTKLLVALQSGKGAPDVADIEIGHYATFLGDNYLLPLNDVVEPYKDQVVMSRISMYGDGKGNYYGIDFHLGASVCYYNMDLMNKAGCGTE
jgi:arabinosaccharide transport system substrate-binding protein